MLHYSVLLKESIELLNINQSGIYVDGTFGRGGHTLEVLKQLGSEGKLIAFDKDIEAIEYGRANIKDKRLTLIHDSFASIDSHLESLQITAVDGVLLDLGVSSPQIDTKERGFSFRFDSDLDMRMNNTTGISCKEWINNVDEVLLSNVLWQYGEERFSRRIAANIVKKRQEKPIVTTLELAKIIENSVPFREKGQHPATRSFQALRIFINNELGDLEMLLSKLPKLLNIGARVVVISFHSLEDRIVKNYFNSLVKLNNLPKWVNVTEIESEYKVIAKKVKASVDEVTENTRSRSATLRALERLSKRI